MNEGSSCRGVDLNRNYNDHWNEVIMNELVRTVTNDPDNAGWQFLQPV